MKKIIFFVVLLLSTNLNAIDLKEGLWEMSVKMEVKGMPMPIPAQKYTQCVTKDKLVPTGEGSKDVNCKVIDYKISGNSITWKMVCKDDEGETTIIGKGTYNLDKFGGETKVKTHDGMEMVQNITGKWIGKCK